MSTTKNSSQNSDFGLPRTEFKPLSQGNSGVKIALIVLSFFIIAGAGAAYWFFYSSSSNDLLKEVDIALSSEVEENEMTEEADELVTMDSEETPIHEENSRFIAPQEGSLAKLTRPQGKYYVVTNCFIDADLAMDYANKLVNQGEHVAFITPKQGQYFFCVAVAESKTLHAANKKLQSLKSLYSNDIWVKKY